MGAQQSGTALRSDIQGLRAVAVGIVVVYHLHAAALPGGFVGVDVFFVISGFLITSHLVSRPPSSGRELAAFWGRRIRRLLPASLLVLTCTLVAVRVLAPETLWESTASDARAAALYVINWALAGRAVDYLAAEEAATAVQHFWSLSVEEQFYFGWPLLVAAVVVLTRRRPHRLRAGLGLVFALVTAGSLAWSIHLTSTNPAAAYFVTPTRIWELAAGGLLAVALSGRRDPSGAPEGNGKRRAEGPSLRPLRLLGAWGGLAMIAAAGVWYDGATPFPGYQAALPVLGAVLVIGCGAPRGDRLSPGPVLALRPVQWLGDVSYSVYLWHWPLIIVTAAVTGHAIGPRTGLAVLVATLVLSGLTERFVERPFRSAGAARSLRRTYALGAVAMGVVVALATTQLVEVHQREDDARQELADALRDGGPCLGAAALTPGSDCPRVSYDDLLPAVAVAAKDKSEAYGDVGPRSCWSGETDFPSVDCAFGDTSSDVRIALFGNSHAGQWLPALQALAEKHHWRIETHLASRCATTDIPQEFQQDGSEDGCIAWVRRNAEEMAGDKPDLVVVSNRLQALAVGHDLEESAELYAEGYTRILGGLVDAGVPVLALRDTPAPGEAIPDCIAANADDYAACNGTRDDWVPVDPVIDVVEALDDPLLTLADLTDRFCGPKVCRAVNGGVISYFDANHMTATYARTLAPYLEPFVVKALAGTG